MVKINLKFKTYRRQDPIGIIQQIIRRYIICRGEPFYFEYAPRDRSEMWAIKRQREKMQFALLPYWPEFFNHPVAVNLGIAKHNKHVIVNTKRETIKKACDLFRCGKSVMIVIAINHANDIQIYGFWERHTKIPTMELPTIKHLFHDADTVLTCKIEVNKTNFLLLLKFMQFLALMLIKLGRVFPLGTPPYTSIYCAKTNKRLLNMFSLACLPQASYQISLAFFTLSLFFSCTIFSSKQSMVDLRLPEQGSKPIIPTFGIFFTQEFTEMCIIAAWEPTSFKANPWNFKNIASSVYGKIGFLPVRKPASNSKRCLSVNCITLIFATTMYRLMQRRHKKSLI